MNKIVQMPKAWNTENLKCLTTGSISKLSRPRSIKFVLTKQYGILRYLALIRLKIYELFKYIYAFELTGKDERH